MSEKDPKLRAKCRACGNILHWRVTYKSAYAKFYEAKCLQCGQIDTDMIPLTIYKRNTSKDWRNRANIKHE